VAKLDLEELKKRLDFSERKRTLLKRMLSRSNVAEDTLLVTVADLMTLLLIFFILFYSRGLDSKPVPAPADHVTRPILEIEKSSAWSELPLSVDQHRAGASHRVEQKAETNESKPSSSLAKAPNREPEAPNSDPGKADTASLQRLEQEVLASFRSMDKGNFSVRIDRSRLILTLGERITFNVGEAELLESFKPTLTRIAGLIAAERDYRVVVAGHTDDTPIYTDRFPSNWELSAARAVNVVKFMAAHGVDPKRMSITGYAEYQPLYENTRPENKQRNRRVEISLIRE
jgi:chemotaxis protein MotB